MKYISLIILILFSTLVLAAQKNIVTDTNSVKSIEGIVKKVLQLVSVKKGQQRDWDALTNLFLPTATFTVLNNMDTTNRPVETIGLTEFIVLLHDEYYEQGYLEYEIGKVINEYNGIANVFQSFYGKDSEGAEERGINSFQLVYFENRWWVAHLLWTLESKNKKIPRKYLQN